MRPFKRHSSENTYEYPPLALNFILLPSYFIPQEIKTEPIILNDYINSYIKYYRFMCFAIELILLLIITSLSCIYCEHFIKAAIPPIYFLILNFCMPVFIFDRIDIFLSLLIVTSIACLFNRKLLLLSYFFLALAICFKIVPIILLPIWIILSLKKENYRNIKSTVLTACKWFLIEIGLIVIITLPHLYFYKTECLSFLKYHLSRGLHIESVAGNIVQLYAHITNTPMLIDNSFGSINIKTGNVYICLITTVLLMIFLIFIYIKFFLNSRRSVIVEEKNISESNVVQESDNKVYNSLYNALFNLLESTVSTVFPLAYAHCYPLLIIFNHKEKVRVLIISIFFIVICIISSNLLMNYYLLEEKHIIGFILLSTRNILLIASCIILITTINQRN